MEQLVTAVPTPLAGLAVGDRYSLQNSHGDSFRILRFSIGRTAPDVGGGAGLAFLEGAQITVDAGDSVFVWHADFHSDYLCTYELAR
ncbi:MAG: hypothetical protein OXC31_11085 [Spirochaetaceae bacterium]|nr:hypothetical protein [Spirochaetaceae bacterium]